MYEKEKTKMARRNYDRMYKSYDEEENKTVEPVVEEVKEIETKEEIKEEPLPQKEVEKKTSWPGRVIGGLSLNVRRKPDANGEIITTVSNGATVEIIEEVNEDWYHIASPNGYVMRKYVQV